MQRIDAVGELLSILTIRPGFLKVKCACRSEPQPMPLEVQFVTPRPARRSLAVDDEVESSAVEISTWPATYNALATRLTVNATCDPPGGRCYGLGLGFMISICGISGELSRARREKSLTGGR